ncbi:efflux transporter outer membrane subunit [Sphingomonas sp. MMSM20]|uniref:efflux transporter outer membrane subunit n=1 Tax=Sphingomonas lycopersici TaxID=2951807 RepID=UPI0022373D1A|nr:efflux transporter outer membrane subunit [Sphingomonas lycopersici]MCW6528991.1 efflux transporter outer membrane subunit [Sphingomonas lycopersici]
MLKPGLALSIALLAAGCTVGPDYRPRAAPPAAEGRFVTPVAGADAAAALPDDWWRLYRDPVLDRLVARALTANTDLRVAAANLARAQAVLSEYRANRLPTTNVSAGTSYGDAQPGMAARDTPQGAVNAGFAAAWEVDLFGRVRRAIEAARADADAVAAARDAVRVAVAAETARSYVDACAYADAAAVARQSLGIAEDNLRLVTLRQQAGSAARLNVEQAAADVASAKAQVAPLNGRREAALFELAALIGETPAGVPHEAAACQAAPAPIAMLPIGDGAGLLRRRPDLREAERRLAADNARIGVATADLYPRISLGGSAGFLHNQDVSGGQSFSFSFGPLLSWSFPNISVARARIRQARAQGDASLATFDGKVLTALKEVEQALAAYRAEGVRRAALLDGVGRAQAAFDLADARYRAGSSSYLDLLVAQRTLIGARATLADSTQKLGSTRIDLFKALGGGWQTAQ